MSADLCYDGTMTTTKAPVKRLLVSQNPARRPGSLKDDRWTNPIIDYARDGYDAGDPWGSALMVLGDLQDYEPGMPVDHADAEAGFISSGLADLDTLWTELLESDYAEGLDDADENMANSLEVWTEWSEHAWRVFDRLADLAKLNGHSY